MINNLIIQGHLTADPVYRPGQNGGKSSCWGKIGVYQGKDQQGNELGSIFIEFTCFGSEADTLAQVAHKGDLIVASGKFSEINSVGNDGKTYVNKKVVGNAKMCYKNPTAQQAPGQAAPQAVQYQQTNAQYQQVPAQPVQYQQAPVQQAYQQAPVQQAYAPAPQAVQQNPWG